MITEGSWWAEARRLLLVLALAGLAGLASGYLAHCLAVAALGLLCFWLYQIRRIHDWLAHPEQEPPESFGLWGTIFDQIYRIQRENREATLRLQSTVDYLRDSFASIRDGVIIVDPDAAIEWANDAARSLAGLDYPKDRGQPLLNLMRVPEFVSYFLAGDYSKPLQITVSEATDRHLLVEVTYFGEGNRLVFLRDVSAMVRTERMRRDFVGNVSHELRTPLTVIKGYLDTMLDSGTELSNSFRRPLEQMVQQADRMESLLTDLLWLSRIEAIGGDDKVEAIDMAALVCEVKNELEVAYPDRLRTRIESRSKIEGDYLELHSAVTNLVQNALKYSDEGTPVELVWREAPGEYVLEVIDQGIGIDESHIPRLTERFYRVDESRSTRTGGSGLGLAIVKHVAAAHDADLRIDSVPGKGSTFTLAFHR